MSLPVKNWIYGNLVNVSGTGGAELLKLSPPLEDAVLRWVILPAWSPAWPT